MSYNSTSYKLPTKEARLEDMRKRAKERGGKCLSKIYINGSSKFTWKCKKGHIWDATPQSIKQGSWCPKCVGRNHNIPFMQKLAKKRGGLCLSKKFIAVTKKLIWQCDKGHKWKAIPASIKTGTWCPKCSSNKHTIEYLQNYAVKYKGVCISKIYKGCNQIIKWECKKGHAFNTSIKNLQGRQSFCLQCRVPDIRDMQKLAKKRGGLCLSKKFIAITKKLTWQCDKGHKWKTIPTAIKMGAWCRKCSSNKHTMEYIQSYATKYKGVCISKKYIGSRHILKWECKKGHAFSTSIENLQRRQSFCLQCRDQKKIIKNKKTTA